MAITEEKSISLIKGIAESAYRDVHIGTKGITTYESEGVRRLLQEYVNTDPKAAENVLEIAHTYARGLKESDESGRASMEQMLKMSVAVEALNGISAGLGDDVDELIVGAIDALYENEHPSQ
jgi:hypothetical protein